MSVVDRSRQPKYWAVVDYVEGLIASSGLQPGDSLPSELDLQRRFGLSRGTVRKALGELTVAGLIERRSGAGTFVAPRRMQHALPELTSFSEHIRSVGKRPDSKTLSVLPLTGVSELAREFPGGTPLIEWVRVRLADDEPVGIHRVVLPERLAVDIGLDADRAPVSLYESLERSGAHLDAAQEHIVARKASRSEAKLLGIPTGDAVLDVRRKTMDSAGAVVEVVQAIYRGDRYDYVIWLQRRQMQ